MADRRGFLKSIVGAVCAVPVAAAGALLPEAKSDFVVSKETAESLRRMQVEIEELNKTAEIARQLSAGAMSSMRLSMVTYDRHCK